MPKTSVMQFNALLVETNVRLSRHKVRGGILVDQTLSAQKMDRGHALYPTSLTAR